jgi:lysophospholipid acyltransferase (LPLAT)-like uncharacterized protein
MLKSLLQHPLTHRVAAFMIASYIRLLWHTTRWTHHQAHLPQQLLAQNQPFFVCFWHAHLLLAPLAWRERSKNPLSMLVSRHRDGQLMAKTIAHFGLGFIAGSSKNPRKNKEKGGSAAARSIISAARAGVCIGITPDGPRGPRGEVKENVVALAKITGLPLLPLQVTKRHRLTLKTWDAFHLALPFGRGRITWGEPLWVNKDADVASMAALLKQRLEALEGESAGCEE